MTSSSSPLEEIAQAAEPAVTESNQNSVHQIRDILFGQQMAEYETRFRQLEARLVEETNQLARNLNLRIDTALQELQGEREQRALAFNELLGQLTRQSEELESARSVTEYQLVERITALGDEMAQKIRDTAEQETQRHMKIRRLFKELSNQLDEDPQQ